MNFENPRGYDASAALVASGAAASAAGGAAAAGGGAAAGFKISLMACVPACSAAACAPARPPPDTKAFNPAPATLLI